jgi:dihydrofolate reductase
MDRESSWALPGMTLPLVLVAAIADNGVIGDDNRLIWRLKTDLRRFRAFTIGRPVVMGRKTFQSIGKPLPGRTSIVLTRDASCVVPEGVRLAHSLDDALAIGREVAAATGADSIAVAGGADIYAQTLHLADRLHLTLVHATPPGDAVFPDFSRSDFVETAREEHPQTADDDHPFTFVDLSRRKSQV